jgi:murein DD-endopeptidase MepM/ murein hydrolase activator NlpD
MIRARRAIVALAVLGLAIAALAASSGPASAELRTLTVTLLGGTQVTVTVDVPPGTPVDQITIPGIPPNQIVSVTEGPPPPSGPSSPGVTVGPAPGSSNPSPPPSSGSSTTPQPAPGAAGAQGGQGQSGSAGASAGPNVGKQHTQRTTGHAVRGPATAGVQPNAKANLKTPAPLAGLRLPNGLPTAANPTLSLALPGPATPGVPDFFIDKFRIPPFLIPIYQAAGTQYDVPWQILAAINEIESDYGRDLSTSTAGAIGWMQFLPQEWQQWGVDATGTGVKDPYNPADAIFAAARYLSAAGARTNLRGAIFAYNHASWYVDSVILRAKLIGGVPPQLLGALTGLTYGHFPVHARARYADDLTEQSVAQRYARTHNVSLPVDPVAHRTGIDIYAKAGAPVIAVQDGRIVGMGHSPRLGSYIRLQDAYGNTYTYSGLKTIVSQYPVPRPTTESAAQIARDLSARRAPKRDSAPTGPATAGNQPLPAPDKAAKSLITSGASPPPPAASAQAPAPAPPAPPLSLSTVASQVLDSVQRFSGAASGAVAAAGSGGAASPAGLPAGQSFNAYFTDVFGLNRNDVVLRHLRIGSKVIAGTILGRIGTTSTTMAPHVLFQIRPAGKDAPLIDPKPVLDGWVLLERTSIYRAKGKNPFINGAPTVGQVLLESKPQLQQQVLNDPNINIYACGRRDIEAGQIDQRVMASMEFLSVSGLRPTVSALKCGQPATAASLTASEHSSGNAVGISAVNGIPVAGHQGKDSITDITVRRLLTLQGTMKPFEIVSTMSYPGTDNTVAMRDHFDHIDVDFLPLYNTDPRIRKQVDSALAPRQWIKLIGRLGQITEPQVSAAPSAAAIPDKAAAPGP